MNIIPGDLTLENREKSLCLKGTKPCVPCVLHFCQKIGIKRNTAKLNVHEEAWFQLKSRIWKAQDPSLSAV